MIEKMINKIITKIIIIILILGNRGRVVGELIVATGWGDLGDQPTSIIGGETYKLVYTSIHYTLYTSIQGPPCTVTCNQKTRRALYRARGQLLCSGPTIYGTKATLE